jgi:hypothetical protein
MTTIAMRRSHAWRSTMLLAVLAQPGAAAAQSCPDVPCVSLFPCTRSVCVDGACVDVGVDCRDADPCTIDACDDRRGGCVHDPYCPDDGTVCNGSNVCVVLEPPFSGLRCVRVPLDCDDGDACTIDGCVEPSGCRHVPVNCDDGDACTADRCAPAVGCLHEPIAGCCRTVADCPTDACHRRQCLAGRCAEPEPLSCDDGDPSTVDTCDPPRGCVHTPPAPPDGRCHGDQDCPADDDPCTTAVCEGARGCSQRSLEGFPRLACTCQRPNPPACAGATVPRRIIRRVSRACAAIDSASGAKPSRTRTLVRRARRQLERAQQMALASGGRSGFPTACSNALSLHLADAVGRADALPAQ